MDGQQSPIRVGVVDDDPLVRSGLTMLLGADDAIEVVAQAGDGDAGVAMVAEHRPDVVLMDIRMPTVDGLTATHTLRQAGPEPKIIILTTFGADENVLRALRIGADGFLLKDTPPTDIIAAVHKVTGGELALGPAMTRLVVDQLRTDDGQDAFAERVATAQAALAELTERELEVALAVGEGLSNSEIGERLFLGVATVKTYMSRVLAKLQCENRVQVAIVVHESKQ